MLISFWSLQIFLGHFPSSSEVRKISSHEFLVNVQTFCIHNDIMNVWCSHNNENITQQVATVESIISPSHSLLHSIKGELSIENEWIFFLPLNILYHCSAETLSTLRRILYQCSIAGKWKEKKQREYNDV